MKLDKYNPVKGANIAIYRALDKLKLSPELILVDGNKYKPKHFISYRCIIKGDTKYLSIAAASILAKNFRDKFMKKISTKFKNYGWDKNMGYATKFHIKALNAYGISHYHRKTYAPVKLVSTKKL